MLWLTTAERRRMPVKNVSQNKTERASKREPSGGHPLGLPAITGGHQPALGLRLNVACVAGPYSLRRSSKRLKADHACRVFLGTRGCFDKSLMQFPRPRASHKATVPCRGRYCE